MSFGFLILFGLWVRFPYQIVDGDCAVSGVWFMHCHLEIHTTWGLKMAFLVDNGKGPKQSLLPPPADLPKC